MLFVIYVSWLYYDISADVDVATADVDSWWRGAGLGHKCAGTRETTKGVSTTWVYSSGLPAVGGVGTECSGLVGVYGGLATGVGGGTLLTLPCPAGLGRGLINGSYYSRTVTLVDDDLVLQIVTICVSGVHPELWGGRYTCLAGGW